MFYDNLKKVCQQQGTTISKAVVECGGKTGSIDGWKKGSIPNSKIVMALSSYLNVSTDYLLFGEEQTLRATMIEVPKPQLTESEEDMLKVFRKLTAHQQCKLIVRAEDMAEENEKNNAQENVG